jgi:phosphate acetyltransferase
MGSNFLDGVYNLVKSNKKTIILPETDDIRVIKAADKILTLGLANLLLIGEKDSILKEASQNGLHLENAAFISQNDESVLEKAAAGFAEIRKSKGVTLDQAREKMKDISYFSTMLLALGFADGMVSGAAHSTAETIVPSFQIIKPKKGISVVSSAFFMLLEDGVKVYADCAVNPNPDPQQLADIAASTASTASDFGINPKVAMLSYSTLGSGSGPDVDLVIEATKKAKAVLGDKVDGPLQYDAAVSPDVAKIKAPKSQIAGNANVFIFPDLQSGNITYKAVQRSTGCIAVGPVLQGLNKPVNDLSRGAKVEDIVNTVALTAALAIFDEKQ